MYRVFRRTWWIINKNGLWPNDLEPHAGRRRYEKGKYRTEADARAACARLNAELAMTMTARQRKLSLKYEYESC